MQYLLFMKHNKLYIYREREIDMHVYIYIYIYTHTHICMYVCMLSTTLPCEPLRVETAALARNYLRFVAN